MGIVSGIIQLAVAVLALIGLAVVGLLLHEEVLPKSLLWWEDVLEGCAHYQAVRQERGIKEDAIGATVRTQEAFELAQQRMAAALERSRPLSSPAHRGAAMPGEKQKPWG